ncbi:hypothetical protein [Nitrospira moscoviensis]|uniref:Uncharacterized protein n=1 Tax=Nitrospira moscoviensis TaxID=42253 RepID=A0A0K2G9G8_NITMO|nr:hypothetical protein [Nitrospira moscoviensis]ALA57499.1 exported protein of unknown function [Nitrospira moscoviensis]
MRKHALWMLLVSGVVAQLLGSGISTRDVHAAGTPPLTKETKPATSTMSGTEQKGNNAGRNANTKPTAPPPAPKK